MARGLILIGVKQEKEEEEKDREEKSRSEQAFSVASLLQIGGYMSRNRRSQVIRGYLLYVTKAQSKSERSLELKDYGALKSSKLFDTHTHI